MARTAREQRTSSPDEDSESDYDEEVPVRTVTGFLTGYMLYHFWISSCSCLLYYQDMSTLFTSVRGNPPEAHRVRFYLGRVAEDKRDDLQQKIEVNIMIPHLHHLTLISHI